MRQWRVLTWVILGVNVLFLVGLIAAVGSHSSSGCGSLDASTCHAASATGKGIAVGLIVFFWAAVDVILGVIYAVTNRNRRTCPACGDGVKRGRTVCKCGYDFRQAAAPVSV